MYSIDCWCKDSWLLLHHRSGEHQSLTVICRICTRLYIVEKGITLKFIKTFFSIFSFPNCLIICFCNCILRFAWLTSQITYKSREDCLVYWYFYIMWEYDAQGRVFFQICSWDHFHLILIDAPPWKTSGVMLHLDNIL